MKPPIVMVKRWPTRPDYDGIIRDGQRRALVALVTFTALRVVAFAIRHSRETCRLHARARIYLEARELCNL